MNKGQLLEYCLENMAFKILLIKSSRGIRYLIIPLTTIREN